MSLSLFNCVDQEPSNSVNQLEIHSRTKMICLTLIGKTIAGLLPVSV